MLLFSFIACKPFMYGPRCTRYCGHCQHGVPCSMDTGACPGGCEEGWIGERCTTCMLFT